MPWDKSKYKLGFSESEIGKDSQIKYRPTEDSTDYKTIHVPWIVVEYILEIKKREFDCFYTEERLDKGNNLEKLRYYVAQYFFKKRCKSTCYLFPAFWCQLEFLLSSFICKLWESISSVPCLYRKNCS